jgi:hypothetical protein
MSHELIAQAFCLQSGRLRYFSPQAEALWKLRARVFGVQTK